jgi:hypothetical protein
MKLRSVGSFIILSASVLAVLSSCKKEETKDITAPVIERVSPKDHAYADEGDTVRFTIHFSDDKSLGAVSLHITEALNDSDILKIEANAGGNLTYTIDTAVIIRHSSNQYNYEIKARDLAGNETVSDNHVHIR